MASFAEVMDNVLARPRYEPPAVDPEDVCLFCDGRGYVERVKAGGYSQIGTCIICGGAASLGVYVVECCAEHWRYQLRFQSQRFAAAAHRATTAAKRLAGSSLKILRVQVLYCPVVDEPQQAPRLVYSVPVLRLAPSQVVG